VLRLPVGEQVPETVLIKYWDSELFGLVGLAAGVLADDDVVGLLRHRGRGLAAVRDDRLLRAVTGEPVERAGDDDGQPGQRLRGVV